jgi:hypothetical protein
LEKNVLVNIGAVFSRLGNDRRSLWFFETADSMYPDDPLVLCWLLFNRYRQGDMQSGDAVLLEVVELVGLEKIASFFHGLSKTVQPIPPPIDVYLPEISRKIRERVELVTKNIEGLARQVR